jgi:gliding motility-associated-like protein
MKIILTTLSILLTLNLFSQKEANNWYFGNKAGISFENGSPTVLTGSSMISQFGSATISDSTGNLLFYTNGESVFNRNHQQMPNGFGLLGTGESQTCIIIKKPGSNSKYYIFTVGSAYIQPTVGLYYSIVDIEKQGGLGDVDNLFKNIPLLNSDLAVEKITAVKHADNNSVWVIVRNLTQPVNEYHAYLITSNGVNSQPKKTNCLSNVPILWSGSNNGQMKFSPDSKYLVATINTTVGGTEIGQFNNLTGDIFNLFNFIQDNLIIPWGVEFSSDSHFIYFTNKYTGIANKIEQYNLSLLPDQGQFINSCINLGIGGNAFDLQVGPDGKIYVAREFSNYLGVINNPSLLGVACDYDSLGVYLGGRKCYRGLPQFIQTYFLRFEYNGQCAGDTFTFTPNFNPVPDSIYWNFGDPASGANNYSNELNPQHLYQTGGLYNVTAFVRYPDGRTETANREVTVAQLPLPYPGNDTLFCKGSSIILQAQSGYDSYLWSTNETGESIQIADSATYWVEATNAEGCIGRSIVHAGWYPVPDLLTDPLVSPTTCGNSTGAFRGVIVSGGMPPYSFEWLNIAGDVVGTSPDVINLPVDNYFLWVSDQSGCRYNLFSDAIQNINSDLIIEDVIPKDVYCDQSTGTLDIRVVDGLSDMLWYSKDNGATYIQNQGQFNDLTPGSYIIKAKDSQGCIATYDNNPVIIHNLDGVRVLSAPATNETDANANGSILVHATGDTLLYSLNGSTPQSDSLFSSLAHGWYSIVVTDVHGCDTTLQVQVGWESAVVLHAMAADTSVCKGLMVSEPLIVRNFKNISAFELTLNYNSSALEPMGYIKASQELIPGLEPIAYPSLGIIKLRWTGATPVTLADNTVLLDLVMQSTNQGAATVDWDITGNATWFKDLNGNLVQVNTEKGTITVNPPPELWSVFEDTFCEGSTMSQMAIAYGGTGELSVSWQTPKGIKQGPEYKIDSVLQDDAGMYKVKIVDQLNCMVTDSIEVKVIAIPVSGIETQNDTIFFNEKFHLEANPGYYIYIWSTGENTNYMDGTEQGSYQLIIKTEEGCSDTTHYMLVNTAVELQMPNAFTPNADGINDCFKPLLDIEKVRHFNMLIYNRWGQRIFETNDPSKGWDARNVPAGIYNWHIIYSNRLGVPFQLRGSVALIK